VRGTTSTCWKLGFRLGPAFLATPLPRTGGSLGLITAVLQEVLGMRGDPEVGQERSQINLGHGQRDQQFTYIRERLDPVSLGAGSGGATIRAAPGDFPAVRIRP
jgi:hypothetical protein